MDVGRWMMATSMLVFYQPAFSQTPSAGKNMYALQKMVFPASLSKYALLSNESFAAVNVPASGTSAKLFPFNIPNSPSPIPNQPLLPRWSAESLPFFCKIEHDFARKNTVPVKFRLGSVEYVDWLEGKSDFPLFAPR